MLQNPTSNNQINNQGVEYLECTFTDSPTPWCATRVDFSGNVITNRQSVNERCLLINCSKFSRVWCWIITLFLGGETVTQQAPLAPQVPPNQRNKYCPTSVIKILSIRRVFQSSKSFPGAQLASQSEGLHLAALASSPSLTMVGSLLSMISLKMFPQPHSVSALCKGNPWKSWLQ